MSNKNQTIKNISLTEKLMNYLIHGKNIPELPKDAYFVPFSSKDKDLNKVNEELLESILKEDKPVVKAQEPSAKNQSWILTPVNF
ncbi:MAG TPA: DUF5647 family protein [Xanthomonadales bacterium]|nr:DUF5647 family protein [Xanthomonadales bacterium]